MVTRDTLYKSKEKRLKIRIWEPQEQKDDSSQHKLEFGHVSLETFHGIGNKKEEKDNSSGIYVSFWPESGEVSYITSPVEQKQPSKFVNAYDTGRGDDERSKHTNNGTRSGKPTFEKDLYCFDIEIINQRFLKMQANGELKNWSLAGKKGKHSCASLVYELLKCGDTHGLMKDMPRFNNPNVNIIPHDTRSVQRRSKWGLGVALIGTSIVLLILAMRYKNDYYVNQIAAHHLNHLNAGASTTPATHLVRKSQQIGLFAPLLTFSSTSWSARRNYNIIDDMISPLEMKDIVTSLCKLEQEKFNLLELGVENKTHRTGFKNKR